MLVQLAERQHTIAAPFTIKGAGVFTGKACSLTLRPADKNTGIVVTTNRGGQTYRIPVNPAHLQTHPNRSTLVSAEDPAVQVNMVEHALSALHGMGVDNAELFVEGGECPLGDGSADDITAGIAELGTIPQDAGRSVVKIGAVQTFEQNGSTLTLEPPSDEGLSIAYTLDHPHPMIGCSTVSYDISPRRYREQIAPARTFITIEEAQALMDAGVLQSTDTECLVIYRDHINHPFRVTNEFAAHKVLDLIGDLRLCGYPVWARVTGHKSGHALNHQAARWIADTQL